jgi:hypothetical protein
MKIVCIDCDERWPIYFLREPFEKPYVYMDLIEVPEDFYNEYVEVKKRYQEFQKKLEKYYVGRDS